jgi:very-short-patch-repair endonuclease
MEKIKCFSHKIKVETVLVTSVRSSELVGINPENKGLIGLKNYIQYAETGYLNEGREPARLLGEETNDFEDSVKRELELRGFKVDAQIGVGSFKIDLAVRDPRNPTGYAIGIECDGASYHSSRSARDRDILRQEILEGMDWKLHRVWSTDWFRNRDEAVSVLVASVNRAISNHIEVVLKLTNIDIDKSGDGDLTSLTFKDRKAGLPYKKAKIHCPKDLIMDPNRVHRFAMIISSIVEDEGPILEEMLLDRIRELSTVARVGANIQSNFESAIKLAIKEGYIEKSTWDKDFFYKSDKKYTNFRTPGDNVERRLGQISAVEIRNAILYLIRNQFGLAYDNMIQSIKPLFGINRADPEETDRLKDIVDDMIDRGVLVKHGPLLNLAV